MNSIEMMSIAAIKRQAKEEGVQEGIQIGEEKKAFKMAINCLQDGLNLAKIAKYTGLSLKELDKLEKLYWALFGKAQAH